MNKLWSARFWTFMMVIATLCYAVIMCITSVFNKQPIDPVVEKVAMFVLGAFVTIVTGMYKDYFSRDDRGNTSTTTETTIQKLTPETPVIQVKTEEVK